MRFLSSAPLLAGLLLLAAGVSVSRAQDLPPPNPGGGAPQVKITVNGPGFPPLAEPAVRQRHGRGRFEDRTEEPGVPDQTEWETSLLSPPGEATRVHRPERPRRCPEVFRRRHDGNAWGGRHDYCHRGGYPPPAGPSPSTVRPRAARRSGACSRAGKPWRMRSVTPRPSSESPEVRRPVHPEPEPPTTRPRGWPARVARTRAGRTTTLKKVQDVGFSGAGVGTRTPTPLKLADNTSRTVVATPPAARGGRSRAPGRRARNWPHTDRRTPPRPTSAALPETPPDPPPPPPASRLLAQRRVDRVLPNAGGTSTLHSTRPAPCDAGCRASTSS